jgi:DNA polymerase-3 subunit gamma/tau
LQELASLMTRLQVAQFAPQAVIEELPERSRLLDLASRLDPEYVQLAYQIAVQGRNELHLAPDEFDGFTMTLLRLYAFRPAGAGDVLPQGGSSPPSASAVPPVKSEGAKQSAKSVPPAAAVKSVPAPEPKSTPADDVSNARPAPLVAGERPDWNALLAALGLGGMPRELAQHCELKSLDGPRIVLHLPPAHRSLQIKTAQDKLQQVLEEHFGHPVQLVIELREVSGETPAATARKKRRERQEQAVASVEQDPFVREVIDMFDATLIDSSIQPV